MANLTELLRRAGGKAYLVPAALFLLAAGLGAVAVKNALASIQQGEPQAIHLEAPGERTVQLAAGDYMLFEDLPAGSDQDSARSDLSCSIEGPGGPATVDRNPSTWRTIKTSAATSVSFATVEVTAPGPHVIKCQAGTSTKVSLRSAQGASWSRLLLAAFALEIISLAAAIVVWRLRRKHGLAADGAPEHLVPAINERWEVAPLWRRFAALGADLIVALLVSKLVLSVFGLEGQASMSWAPGGFTWIWINGWALLLTLLLIFAAYDALLGGGLGKRMFGLRARAATGEEMSFLQACARNLSKPLDLFSFGAMAIADPFYRSISDRLARTLVVRKGQRPPSTPPNLPQEGAVRAVLGTVAGVFGAGFLIFCVYGFARWVQVNQVASSGWTRFQSAIDNGNPAELQRVWSQRVISKLPPDFFQKWLEGPDAQKVKASTGARFTYWQQVNGKILAKGRTAEGHPFGIVFTPDDGGWKVDAFEIIKAE